MSGGKNPFVAAKRVSDNEINDAIERYLSGGGSIKKLSEDRNAYDKQLKKTENILEGGFNPFTKEESLVVDG